jgi:hypothetical protein
MSSCYSINDDELARRGSEARLLLEPKTETSHGFKACSVHLLIDNQITGAHQVIKNFLV